MSVTDDPDFDTSDDAMLARRWASFVDGWPGQPSLADMPGLLDQADVPIADLVVYAHLFHPAGDWWIVGADAERQWVHAFARFGGYGRGAEWGDVSLQELADIRPVLVERDRLWHPAPVREIPEMCQLLGL